MKIRQIVTACVVAVVLAGASARIASAVPPQPQVPVGYCEYAWWILECWFVPAAPLPVEGLELINQL